MARVPTVKVKPTSKEQGHYVVINEDDFDPKVHTKLTDAELEKIEKAAAKAEAEGAESDEEEQA